MKLTNMKMAAQKAKEECAPTSLATDAPRYPWGLCLTLEYDALEKLGIEDLPEVDTELTLTAKVVVTGTSSRQTQGGEEQKSLSLQITDMALAGAKDKDDKPESVLYKG